MILYICFYLAAIGIAFIKTPRDRNILGAVLMFIMMMAVGLRDATVGEDTPTYLYAYAHPGLVFEADILFSLLKWFCIDLMHWTPLCMQLIASMLTGIIVYLFFTRFSVNIGLSILVYMIAKNTYFFECTNIVRQSVSVGCILWCIGLIGEKRISQAIVWFIAGCGFHLSCLFLLPIFILGYYWNPSKKIMTLLIAGSGLFCLAISTQSWLQNQIALLANYTFLGLDKFAYYAIYKTDESFNILGLLPPVVFMSSVGILAYFNIERSKSLIVFCLCVAFNNVLLALPNGFRMMFDAMAYETVIIPLLWYKREIRIWIAGLLTLYLAYITLYKVNPNATTKFAPYKLSKEQIIKP